MNSVADVLLAWLKSSMSIALLITSIVFMLNLLYNILEAYKLIPKLSRGGIAPILKFFWIAGEYRIPVAYRLYSGSGLWRGALMMDQMREGKVTRTDASLLNYHLAVSHSVLEDNLLFVALGVSIWWILGVRFVAAWLVVWIRRVIMKLRYGGILA